MNPDGTISYISPAEYARREAEKAARLEPKRLLTAEEKSQGVGLPRLERRKMEHAYKKYQAHLIKASAV